MFVFSDFFLKKLIIFFSPPLKSQSIEFCIYTVLRVLDTLDALLDVGSVYDLTRVYKVLAFTFGLKNLLVVLC